MQKNPDTISYWDKIGASCQQTVRNLSYYLGVSSGFTVGTVAKSTRIIPQLGRQKLSVHYLLKNKVSEEKPELKEFYFCLGRDMIAQTKHDRADEQLTIIDCSKYQV